LVFHPIGLREAQQALGTLSEWLLLDRFQAWIVLSIMGAAVLASGNLLLIVNRSLPSKKSIKAHTPGIPTFPRLLLVSVIVYVSFLATSVSFFDAHTSFDDRILSPLYLSALFIVLCMASTLLSAAKKNPSARALVTIVGVAFLASSLLRGTLWLVRSHSDGVGGYAGQAWQTSETLEQVRTIPHRVPIFSNGPDAIYILTSKLAYMIPKKVDPQTRRMNESSSSELTTMMDQLQKQDGVLVYFKTIGWRVLLAGRRGADTTVLTSSVISWI
jgi:hypothetical protein